MKAALLLLLVASTAAADTLTDGDVYLIRADGWADVTCEKWKIDGRSLEHRKGKLYERVDFDVDGSTIQFTQFEHTLGLAIGAEDVYAKPACKLSAEVTRTKLGWQVGTAVWFSTKKACVAALAKHERVGTTFGCPTQEDFPLFLTAYLNDFDTLLTKGGTMFQGPACTRVKLGPGTEHDTDAKTVKLCGAELSYEAKEDRIQLGAARLYFFPERCRAYERARAHVARYLPVVATTDASSTLPSCK